MGEGRGWEGLVEGGVGGLGIVRTGGWMVNCRLL